MADVKKDLENLRDAETGPEMRSSVYGSINDQNMETQQALEKIRILRDDVEMDYREIEGANVFLKDARKQIDNMFYGSVTDFINAILSKGTITFEGKENVIIK